MQKVWIAIFKVKVTLRFQIFERYIELLQLSMPRSAIQLSMLVHHLELDRSVKSLVAVVKGQRHCVGLNPQYLPILNLLTLNSL